MRTAAVLALLCVALLIFAGPADARTWERKIDRLLAHLEAQLSRRAGVPTPVNVGIGNFTYHDSGIGSALGWYLMQTLDVGIIQRGTWGSVSRRDLEALDRVLVSLEGRVTACKTARLPSPPPMVLVDGLWVTIAYPTGEIKVDAGRI